MFASMAGTNLKIGSWPYPQILEILERLVRYKHSSLLVRIVSEGDEKSFNDTDTCDQCYITFYGRKLRLFIIS